MRGQRQGPLPAPGGAAAPPAARAVGTGCALDRDGQSPPPWGLCSASHCAAAVSRAEDRRRRRKQIEIAATAAGESRGAEAMEAQQLHLPRARSVGSDSTRTARPDMRRTVAAAAAAATAAAWAGLGETERWGLGAAPPAGSMEAPSTATEHQPAGGLLAVRSGSAVLDDVDFADDEVLQGRICCPAHFCQSCHMSGDAIKLVRCWLCPRAYHTG